VVCVVCVVVCSCVFVRALRLFVHICMVVCGCACAVSIRANVCMCVFVFVFVSMLGCVCFGVHACLCVMRVLTRVVRVCDVCVRFHVHTASWLEFACMRLW
jgi:hypothetical protein